jgi:uncharacterized membrane protein YccC
LKSPPPYIRLAVKTAVAGCVAMYFARLLRLPEPYWASISAMIVMQANLGAAVQQSWIRFAATAVGAAVSIPFVAFAGQSLPGYGVAVFITCVLCGVLHLLDGLRLAAVTVAIVMLIPHTGHPWAPALERFLAVSFGILVALLVAEFFWPASAAENLRMGVAAGFLQLDLYLAALLRRHRGENAEDAGELREKLAAQTTQNATFHTHGNFEPARWTGNWRTLAQLMEHQERLNSAADALDIASDQPSAGVIYAQLQPEFRSLYEGISEALRRMAEGIRTRIFSGQEFDFSRAIEELAAKAEAARNASSLPQAPLDETLRSHTFYFGLETLARELAAAQITARGLLYTSGKKAGDKKGS